MAHADMLDLQRRIIALIVASGLEFPGDLWADGDIRTSAGLYVGSVATDPATGDGVFTNDVRAGAGLIVGSAATDPPAGELHVVDATDPLVRISEGGSATSYTQFQDVSAAQSIWKKVVNAGAADLLIEPIVTDGVSAAQIRLFRETNTAGLVSLAINKGNNTATINHLLAGNGDSYMCADNGVLGIGAAPSGTYQLEVFGDSAYQYDLRIAEGLQIGDLNDPGTERRIIQQATKTLSAGVSDSYFCGWTSRPTYTGAFTVTRHQYMLLYNPVLAGSAVLTDAFLFRTDANAGTHKMIDSGTTKTTPGTVNAWVKISINGTTYYIPCYTSKTT